jgi:dipeptidyl aminopeptidase/acylaminoacyl peptidase
MPLPGSAVPSTAGKVAFVSNRSGHVDLWMMNGADGSGAVALTNDAPEDRSPAWSPNGSEIAFVSTGRAGVNPQIFRIDAKPGSTALQVTNTSSSKDDPRFNSNNSLLILNAGKLIQADLSSNETNAVIPPPDEQLMDLIRPLLSTGGFERVLPTQGGQYLGVLKLEEGRALLLWEPGKEGGIPTILLLGMGERIQVANKPDGGFVVVFTGGAPFTQPVAILNDEVAKNLEEQAQGSMQPIPPHLVKGVNLLVSFLPDGQVDKAAPPEPFPVPAQDLALSPDGTKVVFAFAEGSAVGLFVHPLNTPGKIAQLWASEASSPAWSPDSQKIAFVSGKEIYVVPAAGGEAKDLTNGAGDNSSPVWSPAKPQK